MDTYAFLNDPRTLTLPERHAARRQFAADQEHWLRTVRRLAEPPVPADDFPAFLLATPPFATLAARLGTARKRADLSTETADELDWFVARFAGYLRTVDGEDVFDRRDSA